VLSKDETRRYARHIVLKGVGGEGQQKLKAARVLVVGAGGLGSPVIAYLAAAGVGTLGVVDHDMVSLSNLQRQVIHRTDGAGVAKVESAGAFVAALNPHVGFIGYAERIGAGNAASLIAAHDLVIDGTDDFDARGWLQRRRGGGEAARVGRGVDVRRAGDGIHARRAWLWRPRPRPPRPRGPAGLRSGWRARRGDGCHRNADGDGGDQAHHRARHPSGRAPAAL